MSIREKATEIIDQFRTYGTEYYNEKEWAVEKICQLVCQNYQKGKLSGYWKGTEEKNPNADEPEHRSQWREPLTGDPLRPKQVPISGDAL